jgi:hypothetical protein
MAAPPTILYRNYSNDDTVNVEDNFNEGLPSPSLFEWNKAGSIFTGWNTNRDGTGTLYPIGSYDGIEKHLYAIWEEINDVSIYYNNNKVSSMSDSGTRTLTTSGKYCEGNITVKYVKPNEDNDMIFLTATGTSDTTLTLFDNAITTVPLTTQVTGNASDALSIAENGIKILKDGNYLVCGSIYY